MALPTWYDTGTVSVANGATLVVATGAYWGDDTIMAADLFCDPAQPMVPPQRIVSITYDGGLAKWTAELLSPWPGTSLTDDAYEIRYVGIIERSTAQTRRVLEQLGEVSAYFDIQVDDTAARLALESVDAPLRANYRVLVSDVGDGTAAIYSKASSAYDDWTDPAPYSGPVGPTGPTGPEGMNWQGAYGGGTAYVLDDGVLYNGSSWIALQATTGNAPPTLPTESNAYWQLLARQGTDGAGTVSSVVAGAGIAVDNTDPTAPVVSVDPAVGYVVGPASATDGRLAGFDGTSGKLLEELTPINARLASDMFVDYLIQGLKPDKLSTNVLRLYPGVAGSADGQLMVRTTVNYDIDMSTNGVGGLDTGSPVGGLDYFVYVLRNNTTGAFAAVISNSITYGGVTLPAGHTHVRKLRFGFIYNVSWDGIPNHDAANWPWPLIRLTGSEASSVWRALNAGTSTTNAEVLCDDWIPDNCRIAMIMVRVACGASAGTGYITSSGAGHSNGIEFTGVPNSTYTAYVPAIRVDSLRKLLYKVTGDVALSIFVLGYYATEPS